MRKHRILKFFQILNNPTDHPLLCFLPLYCNIAVLVAAMLLLSFLSDRRLLSPVLHSFIFFEISAFDLGVATMLTNVFR